MFKRLSNHLRNHKVKYIALVSLIISLIFVKVVLIDVVYVGKQYEKNRIVTPWGDKIKSGNLSVDLLSGTDFDRY